MSTLETEQDCCRKTRTEWERKIALYYSSFPVIKDVPCETCRRVLQIRVFEPRALAE
jgi:hypothetical protein